MRATGIIRRLDELGRIVVPREIRRTMHLKEGDRVELFVHEDYICMRKYFTTALEENMRDIENVLSRRHIRYALYDNDMKLTKDAGKVFPHAPAEGWQDGGEIILPCDRKAHVFPIRVDNAVEGYLVVKDQDEGTGFIRGIVAMIEARIAID